MARKKKRTVRKASKKVSKKSKHRRRAVSTVSRRVVASRDVVVVYGMKIDQDHIIKAAQEAYARRRYTVHDIRLPEYVTDPKFRNLMVKISILDRIEEELNRRYPELSIIRPNTVTLMLR